MWYLIDIEAGVVATAKTKKEISFLWDHCERVHNAFGRFVYEVWSDDGFWGFLYPNREHAEADGYGFALKIYHEGGTRCTAIANGKHCIYRLFGYCSKEPVPSPMKYCPAYPFD